MQKADVGGGLCAIMLLGLWALSFSSAGAYETLYMLKIRRKRCDVKHLENRFVLACCIYIRAGVCLGGVRAEEPRHLTSSRLAFGYSTPNRECEMMKYEVCASIAAPV